LLEEVASFARSNNYKILPVCPFAKNVMYKYPDQYKDLL
jgi:predicted GNAT family acetyltransferase